MFYSKFLESVERWPSAIAIEFQRQPGSEAPLLQQFTYSELRRQAESVGNWLNKQGLPAGARCAILAANGPRWVAAYLGIIASGRAGVPLDIAFHPDQVRKLLRDSEASLFFVDPKHLPVAIEATQDLAIKIVMLSRTPETPSFPNLDKMFEVGPESFTPAKVDPDDIACLLYTSGTTSDPKGVMLSHSNLAAEIESVRRFIPLTPSDGIIGVLPLFHALAQMANIMVVFSNGARVVYLESLNTTELLRALQERNTTVFCCVPQFFYLIHEKIFKQVEERGKLVASVFKFLMGVTRTARKVGINPGKLFFRPIHKMLGSRMRYLVTGGSRFDPAIGNDLQALGFNMLQAYGLTETSGGAICTPPNDNAMGSIGKPLPGVEAKIVDSAPDDRGRMVGEIAIRGGIVMKGYYKRPDATAQVIRDGWLHSGDLGYKDENGNIFITGRKKDVIVLSSGKNIYPEELEAHYLQSPNIKEICVLGFESRPGEPFSERLHAVVVPNFDLMKQKKIVNVGEIVRYDIEGLSAQLPSTKRILSYEIWRDELPRTTTRKLRRFEIEKKVRDRQAVTVGPGGEEIGTARPLTAEEQQWLESPEVARAIGVIKKTGKAKNGDVRPTDSLELDLGLDSMERVELMVALERELGAEVEDSAASEVYTVREMVDLVRQNAGQHAHHKVTSWDAILSEDADDPDVLAITRRRPIIEPLWYLFGRFCVLLLRDLFQLKVSGMEKIPLKGPFIICPNHQSFLDAPVLIANLPYCIFANVFYVGTSEIFGEGFMRKFARFLRLIPVDPDANLVPAMKAGAYGLRKGKILCLYPEGERSIDGPPKTFKKGAAILARHLNVPIVPVALEGFHDAWPRGKSFQGFRPLRLQVGDPIYPDPNEPPEKAYERLTAELKSSIMTMWTPMHERYPR